MNSGWPAGVIRHHLSTCYHLISSHPGLDVSRPQSRAHQISKETFTHTDLELDPHHTVMPDFSCRLATSAKFRPLQPTSESALALEVHQALFLCAIPSHQHLAVFSSFLPFRFFNPAPRCQVFMIFLHPPFIPAPWIFALAPVVRHTLLLYTAVEV